MPVERYGRGSGVGVGTRARTDADPAGTFAAADLAGSAAAHLAGSAAAHLAGSAAAENFPVAGRLLPPRLRRDLLALYAFARSVDDLGDEGTASVRDRLLALDAVEADLDLLYAGGAPAAPFVADLAATVREHDLPRAPFADLVQANRQDQTVTHHATWAQLRDYCRVSAEPVGRLVLGVVDAGTPARVAASDEVCSALQVVEHLQDVREDARRGRVYLPAEDLARFGVAVSDLTGPASGRSLRALVSFEAARARVMLDHGTGLVGGLRGGARLAVAGFVAGGRAALDAIADAGGEVLADPVRPRPARVAARTVALLAGRS